MASASQRSVRIHHPLDSLDPRSFQCCQTGLGLIEGKEGKGMSQKECPENNEESSLVHLCQSQRTEEPAKREMILNR